jgi:hypothetical protein
VGKSDTLTVSDRTTGIIKGAHELGGRKLKRIVLLGSAVSVLDSFQDESVAGKDYTEEDWNPVSLPSHQLHLTIV